MTMILCQISLKLSKNEAKLALKVFKNSACAEIVSEMFFSVFN